MKQYNSIKVKYPDAILLFRVGDFYETFGEDAIKASQILGIVLTRRANGSATYIELAGFPYHSLDNYLPKLVRAGFRVAICDQLEDPKLTKTIVKRGITELVTPGVSFNDKVLDHKKNNFLASIYFDKEQAGVSFLDISTGEFLVGQGNIAYVERLIQNFKPNEILYEKNKRQTLTDLIGERFYIFGLEDWAFTYYYGYESLMKQFETVSLKGFGIEELKLAISSCGALLHYLNETKHDKLKHITKISRVDEDQYVWLDKFTVRNLELFGSNNENGKGLIDIIDKTTTPMGSRLLKRWLALPLKSIDAINERLQGVDYFLSMVDSYLDLRRELTRQLDHWQAELLSPATRFNNWSALLDARLSLHALDEICEDQHTALQDWIAALESWPQAETAIAGRERDLLKVRSRDVLEHIERVVRHVRRLEQNIETTVQLHFNAQSNRTNEIMRTLTVLTAVFLPLNLITGFFGMNFEYLPLIHRQSGLWWALGIMATLALVFGAVMWRKRYLARTSR